MIVEARTSVASKTVNFCSFLVIVEVLFQFN
jgi:hypothetical protein